MIWQTLAAIAAVAAVLGAGAMWFSKVFLPIVRKWSRRWDKIFGVPADPDTRQEHIPGIFERMDAQDVALECIRTRMGDQDAMLERIRKEVEPNHGSSMNDKIKKIEERLDTQPLNDQSTTININPTEPTT